MLLLHQGIILYQSKYGTTQKYANWLSDKTGFDCVAVNKADIKKSCSIMNSIGMGNLCLRNLRIIFFKNI